MCIRDSCCPVTADRQAELVGLASELRQRVLKAVSDLHIPARELAHQLHICLLYTSVFPGTQGGPLLHVIAGKAVALKEAQSEDFKVYQRQTVKNAAALAVSLKEKGFRLVSDGTDNHLILIDVRNQGITGKEAEKYLDQVGITVNKNAIPFDPEKPNTTSGCLLYTSRCV